MITWFHGHLHPHVIPPIETGTDGEHDSLLRWWLIRSRRNEQPRPPDPVRVELLDHDPIEKRTKLVAHRPQIIGWAVDRPGSQLRRYAVRRSSRPVMKPRCCSADSSGAAPGTLYLSVQRMPFQYR